MQLKNTPPAILAILVLGISFMTIGTAHANPGGPPPNDSCGTVSPVDLNVGDTLTFTGDNTGADTVGDAEAGTLLDDYGPNVWHIFTTTECADVTVSYCGTTPAFGNVWNLLATTCPANDVLIGATSFNDTDCGDGNRTTFYNDLPAGTYYLPVLLDPFSSIGPYTIDVIAASCISPGPPNDDCASVVAQGLAVGDTIVFTGDNTGADSVGDAAPGTLLSTYGEEVWHLFTTTECTDVTVDYCDGATVFANYWNLLATSCPATDVLVYATTFNNVDCANGNRSLFFDDLPAGTYYIPVLTDPFSVGPYSIEVSAVSCVPLPPPNDLCDGTAPEVLLLNGSLTFTGDNTLATTTNDAEPGTLLDIAGLPVVWHAFTMSECMSITVDYCGTDPVFGNWYNLLATTCPANDVLVFADSSNDVTCLDGNHTIFYSELAAGTYYIPVLLDPFSNAAGPYVVNVLSDSCTTTMTAELTAPAITVFPNPGQGEFTIIASDDVGAVSMELVDAGGKSVITRKIVLVRGQPQPLIGASKLAPGSYVLRLTSAKGTSTHRIVVN